MEIIGYAASINILFHPCPDKQSPAAKPVSFLGNLLTRLITSQGNFSAALAFIKGRVSEECLAARIADLRAQSSVLADEF